MGLKPTDTIEEEAAHWLIEQKEPGFTSENRRQMAAWLDAECVKRYSPPWTGTRSSENA